MQFSFYSNSPVWFFGERDAASDQIGVFPFSKNPELASKQLKSRIAILDASIKNLEGRNRSATFSRMAAEQILLRSGQRENGLKYGDYLINKYPTVPSNFGFRGWVDFGQVDFAHSIAEYDQFLSAVEKLPLNERAHWISQLYNPIWACIDAGRFDDALKFLEALKDLGGNNFTSKISSVKLRSLNLMSLMLLI